MHDHTETPSDEPNDLAGLSLLQLHRKRAEVSERMKTVTDEIISLSRQLAGMVERRSVPSRIPAVPVERSVGEDSITCLFDGESMQDLERHLQGVHGMSPDEYRRHFMLPSTYPIRIVPNSKMATAEPRQAVTRPRGAVTKGRTASGKTRRIVDTRAANLALDGIDRRAAILQVMEQAKNRMTSREIAEEVMRRAERQVDYVTMMDVTSKLTVTLNNLFTQGKLRRGGSSYRREWSFLEG